MATEWSRNWTSVAVRGLAAVVFGLLLLFWPAPTLLTIIYIFGIFVLVEGVTAVVSGLRPAQGAGVSWGLVIIGIIGILAGIAVFVWPTITGLIVLFIIAFWAMVAGVAAIIAGVSLRRATDEWLLIASGIVALFFGLILLFAPVSGVLAVTFFVGFFGLIYGALQLILAFRLRRMQVAGRP